MSGLGAAPAGAPIAIIGIGCRFPGGAGDVESLWQLLAEGRDAISDIPRSRMDVDRFFDPRPTTPGKMVTRWGGFLENVEEFDAEFFSISPREAEYMDPQQRLLLEVAWEALEDAGQNVTGLDGTPVGVFIGQWISDFEARLFADPEAVDFFMTQGSGRYAASGRISYAFGFRGPSLTIDTACSSSLAAVHLAMQSIRSRESQVCLAGGVNVILQPHISIAYSQSGMMAKDGRCKFGDVRGDGYVRSEGAGIIVLKALDRAVDDGDRIYAVIRGSALNNDGRSSGSMGTPSQVGQEELLRTAYTDAGIAPSLVSYVEAHGTGTRAGDPVEINAIARVLGQNRPSGHPICLGSIKTNFGHCEGAAGVAGLIKTALALQRRAIPPSLHCETPTPEIAWIDRGCELVRSVARWPRTEYPPIAGVSAFGISGTNAHVVLQAVPSTTVGAVPIAPCGVKILPLSAQCPEGLRALAGKYAEWIAARPESLLKDVCWTAATRRTPLKHRAAFVAVDRNAMTRALRNFAAGEPAAAQGAVQAGSAPKIAFICPGQGGQWIGMARQLIADEPVFGAAMAECDRAARRHVAWSLLEQVAAGDRPEGVLLGRIDVIQPALVAIAIAYARLFREFGIDAAAVVGHSMGEISAACIAGALSVDDAMRIACRRGALLHTVSGCGAMALVELSREEAELRIGGWRARLTVAASNSPRSSIISGDVEAVDQLITALQRDDIFCRRVNVDVASHSPQMEPLASQLVTELEDMRATRAAVPFYSTVVGRRVDGRELNGPYWGRNLRDPVLFTEAIRQVLVDGITNFVELGPHPVLIQAIEQTAHSIGVPAIAVAPGRRDESDRTSALVAVGQLWANGYALPWQNVMADGGQVVPLPSYPWQRKRYWTAAVDPSLFVPETPGARKVSEESLKWLYTLRWEASDLAATCNDGPPDGDWVVFAADHNARSAFHAAFASVEMQTTVSDLDQLESTVAQQSGGRTQGIVIVASDNSDAAYLPVRVLQAVLKNRWAVEPRLWWVTRGAKSVDDPGKSRVSVDQAALWGTARVVAEEHPNLWGGIIDLDPNAPIGDSAANVVQQVLAADGEDQIAFRSNKRFVLRLAPCEQTDCGAVPFIWRTNAAYLITGGLGGVGLHIAHEMAARGARRLVLLNRTPLPHRCDWSTVEPDSSAGRRIAAIRGLERMGVAVHIAALDVADEEQVREFLDRYAAESWPPIRGVIHTAGSLKNHLAGDMTRQAFDAVLAPKLNGARILDRLLPDLDTFIMFSSTGAFLAQPGQANYAAANAGLDAVASDRQARGVPALSIGWGVWANTGLVNNQTARRNVASLERQGIHAFSAEEGRALFGWLTRWKQPFVSVLPIDWSVHARARAGRRLPLFANLVSDCSRSPLLSQRIAVAGREERRRLINGVVKEIVGKILKISFARLDPHRAFGEMGLTSLMALELRNGLEAALARPLSATLAWNYPTIEALAEHLAESELTEPRRVDSLSPEVTEELSFEQDHVAHLSEEEAVRALRRTAVKH
jgi:acyl transferase domain-containing protein